MKKDLNNVFYLSGMMPEPNHYPQNFPSKHFDGDTWRKKIFFEDFWFYYPHDLTSAMNVLKKVWINHALSNPERRKQVKTGLLTTEYILSKCVDNCPMCNKKMWYGRCVNGIDDAEAKPSIDRLIPKTNGGEYVDGNVWIICRKCNTYKNDQTSPEQMKSAAAAWKEELKNCEKYENNTSPLLNYF